MCLISTACWPVQSEQKSSTEPTWVQGEVIWHESCALAKTLLRDEYLGYISPDLCLSHHPLQNWLWWMFVSGYIHLWACFTSALFCHHFALHLWAHSFFPCSFLPTKPPYPGSLTLVALTCKCFSTFIPFQAQHFRRHFTQSTLPSAQALQALCIHLSFLSNVNTLNCSKFIFCTSFMAGSKLLPSGLSWESTWQKGLLRLFVIRSIPFSEVRWWALISLV